MCGRTVLPADVANHPRCEGCSILLEPELNEKTLCRCGKYHNAPSIESPGFCRACMGDDVPTGTPKGEPVKLQEDEEYCQEPEEFYDDL
jgi:hypothetical protein